MNTNVVLATPTPGWADRLAYWVSHLASPPIFGLALIGLIGFTVGTSAGWYWAVSYLALAAGVPCLYLLWLYRRGELHDLHLPVREQRIRPLIVTLVATAAAGALLAWAGAPRPLLLLAAVNTAQTALFLAISLRWKTSFHTVAAANFAVLALALGGVNALPALLLIPLVGWARIRLRRHSPSEATTGVLIGMATMLIALWVLGWRAL
jgi:membrane-associated phospholipid phosphatase